MLINNYRDLEIWQEAMALCKEVYRLSLQFPKDEKYGLVSQIRRSAISVPSNIAEGFSRRGSGDKKYLINVAISSIAELETQIELSASFDYISAPERDMILEISDRLGRKITRFIQSID